MNNIDFKKLGDYVKIKTGKLDANASSEYGEYPFFTCSIEPLKISSYSYDCECCLVAGNGDLNVKYYNGKFDAYQRTYIIESLDKEKLDVMYLYFFLSSYIEVLRKQSIGGVIKYIKLGNLTDALIPIPELSKQKEICQNLIKAKKILSSNENLLSKYDTLIKSRFIEMFGDPVTNPMGWEVKKLKETAEIITGNTPSRKEKDNYGTHIEWIKTDNITNLTYVTTASESLSEIGEKLGRSVEAGAILMACIAGSLRSIGRVALTDRKVAFNQQINAIVPKQYNNLFLYVLFQNTQSYAQSTVNMALKGILSKGKLEELEYIVPPLELQNDFATFVQQIDKSKFVVQKSLEKAETLYKSLMQEYFG